MKSALVVLGATGSIGRGVVAAAVEAGWPLIAVARDGQVLKRLRERHPRADLTLLTASVADDGDAARLVKALRKHGRPIGGVVDCVSGPLERGRLLDHPAAFLRRKFDEEVVPHLSAARHLLPLLAEGNRGGGYVLVGGPGSEHPWAGYGHRSIGAAALQMLARVLHDEARALPVRVQLLAIERPVCTEDNRMHACAQWPSALAVGRRALALIARPGGVAEAVVRYSAADDVDFAPFQSTDEYPDPDTPADAATPHADPSGSALLPSRCLQDARNLLKTLTSPNRNQEPSSP